MKIKLDEQAGLHLNVPLKRVKVNVGAGSKERFQYLVLLINRNRLEGPEKSQAKLKGYFVRARVVTSKGCR